MRPVMRNEMQSEFEMLLSRESFKFSSSLFVARHGHRQRLHGHDFQVSVRLTGSSTIACDGTFVNKSFVRHAIDRACKELDERFLCPMNSNVIDITVSQDECRKEMVTMVCQDGSTFSFPKSDCAMLPLVHTTTEEIATYLWGRIVELVTTDYLLKKGVLAMQINIAEGREMDETTVRLGIPSKLSQSFNVTDFMRTKEVGRNTTPIPFVIRESSPAGSLDDLVSEEMSQLSVDMAHERAEV